MSAILELNDQALNLYRDGQLVASSPGYALVHGKVPVFGDEAAAKSRLHPVNSYNEFWHRLGMDPLPRQIANFRHHADMAYAHLMHLSELSAYQGELVIAVPGSFSREQLAVLSGIAQQSPFVPKAMVDTAIVAATAAPTDSEQLAFIDLQLHQATITVIRNNNGRLQREQVLRVQGGSWHGMANSLVQTVNDAFIEQCRFNPQHSAQWEQQLYNEVPDWLRAINSATPEISIEIETDQARHKATVQTADILGDLQMMQSRIEQQLAGLASSLGGSLPVLLSSRAALMPGLKSTLQAGGYLAATAVVSGEQLAEAALRLAANAPGGQSAVPFIQSARRQQAAPENTATHRHEPATHVLLDGLAWPLSHQTWIAAAEVPAIVADNPPGTVLERAGKRLQLIRVQHGG
ncbi:MAG: hypothetical protein CMQ46_10215 [Gammaproteobacteria bacterium]|nr:hypothetical protein [Gammaproteobacteria bacterium]MBJ55622.1 hypothetical protein [Gammaproteobacteria bacterium]HBN16024.1 hypothetical protein [Pseudohongiella sp.]|tara:strand:+ start:1579 stop:2796 length:1218 start_codon:yes stop_codon:yes gene_type:complete